MRGKLRVNSARLSTQIEWSAMRTERWPVLRDRFEVPSLNCRIQAKSLSEAFRLTSSESLGD